MPRQRHTVENTGKKDAKNRTIWRRHPSGREFVKTASGGEAAPAKGYGARQMFSLTSNKNTFGRPIYEGPGGRRVVHMVSAKTGREYWAKPATRVIHAAGPTNRRNIRGLTIHRGRHGGEYVMRPHSEKKNVYYRAKPMYSLFD